jgi:hypothetical protein
MRQILLAREEPHEWPALLGHLVADRSPQHGIPGLKCIKDRTLCDLTLNVEFHLVIDLRQCS